MPRGNGRAGCIELLFLMSGCLASTGCDRAALEPVGPPLPPPMNSARLPGPPPPETEGSDGPPRAWFLRDIRLNQSGNGLWRQIGFDLDQRCTTLPENGDGDDAGGLDGYDIECSPVTANDAPPLDGEDCRDNSFGFAISLALVTIGSDVEGQLNENLRGGRFGPMVRLFGYNGTANDPSVSVEIAQSAFGVPADGRAGDPLEWNGQDTLFPARASLDEREQPIIIDRTAYVVDGTLVARIPPRADVTFSGGDVSLNVRVTDASLTARIGDERLEDVVLAGRWAIADLVRELDSLGICQGTQVRQLVENGIRGAADLLSNPNATPGGLSPCDAVSAAFLVTGYPIRWGKPAREATTEESRCRFVPDDAAVSMPDAGVLPSGRDDAGP